MWCNTIICNKMLSHILLCYILYILLQMIQKITLSHDSTHTTIISLRLLQRSVPRTFNFTFIREVVSTPAHVRKFIKKKNTCLLLLAAPPRVLSPSRSARDTTTHASSLVRSFRLESVLMNFTPGCNSERRCSSPFSSASWHR